MGSRENLDSAWKVFQHWMKHPLQASNLSCPFFGNFLLLDLGNPITSSERYANTLMTCSYKDSWLLSEHSNVCTHLSLSNEILSPPLLNYSHQMRSCKQKGLRKYKAWRENGFYPTHCFKIVQICTLYCCFYQSSSIC